MPGPLDLYVELVNPDGTTFRWGSDEKAPDRPTGISFRTKRFDGFADASVTLHRRIDQDYPDLALFDGLNLIGGDGSVAYEGRIGGLPRDRPATGGPSITVQTQGWMAHAKDQSFVEVYVDRDLSKWVAPSRARNLALVNANYTKQGAASVLPDTTGNPVVDTSLSDAWAAPALAASEAWWGPYPGITIGSIYAGVVSYQGVTGGVSWNVQGFIAANDTLASSVATANLAASTPPFSNYLYANSTVGVPGNAAAIQLAYGATPAGAAGATYSVHWGPLAVYGNHGVAGQAQGTAPAGLLASDVIKNICSRFAPLLNTSGVQATSFVIPHLSFLNETLPYDAFLQINKFHLWELLVYENKTLQYRPKDLTDFDWDIRLADSGTTVNLQGQDATQVANGVIVRYIDLGTGRETRLTPTGFAGLQDTSVTNPANRAGINAWTTLTLSEPYTQAAALQIGAAYLAEYNQPKAPGSITVKGYVRDRAGHKQPGWKVRAGDRLAVTDYPNDRPRLIQETDWNHDSKTLTIAVDSQFKRLDAVLDRMATAIQASNLSLPQ